MDRQDLTFKANYIHPEEEPNKDEINEVLTSAKADISYIDESIIKTATDFNNLLLSTRLKLLNIKELLNAERERQQDINILCNKFSEFSSVMNLNEKDFSGNLTFEDNILQSKILSKNNVNFSIGSIDGNGYAGNKYVYLNDSFIEEVINADQIKNINDNNLATSYEYSRITVNNEEEAPLSFNRDSIEAECSVLITAENAVNHIKVSSERDDLVLKEVYTSEDGLSYKLDKEYNISMNSRPEVYNDSSYIYGSGIITIEPSKHIKIIFKSNGYTDDQLAFIKTFYSENINSSAIKKIIKINSAKRHVIKLNNIQLFQNTYAKGMVVSNELITSPIKCISLYCNEYINDNYTIEKNVSYYLILNGQEFKVEPINSHRDGKKIARTSSQVYKSEHVIYLNEEIKSAKLKIVMHTSNADITPYLSDIKVLIGGV